MANEHEQLIADRPSPFATAQSISEALEKFLLNFHSGDEAKADQTWEAIEEALEDQRPESIRNLSAIVAIAAYQTEGWETENEAYEDFHVRPTKSMLAEEEVQEFIEFWHDPWWDNMSRWDRASYLAYQKEEAQCCHASLTTGPSCDPCMTTCDRKVGHKGPHEGWDPIGGEERMRWTGGGYCAGDELPHFITATFKPHPLAPLAKAARRWFSTLRIFLFHSCK